MDIREFLKREMPELNRELGPLTLPYVLEVFNAMCQMDVQSYESVTDSCTRFYAKLIGENDQWRQLAEQRGIAKAQEIKQRREK